jgi:hypothetical protein
VFCISKICFSWSKYFLLKNFLPLTSFIYYITIIFNKYLFSIVFILILYIYFYPVKDVLIKPSNKKGLRVDKLTIVFNCTEWDGFVGTTIDPNVPTGISKMFVFIFIFFNFCFLLIVKYFYFFYYIIIGIWFFFYYFIICIWFFSFFLSIFICIIGLKNYFFFHFFIIVMIEKNILNYFVYIKT